jgi:hypothetical protein
MFRFLSNNRREVGFLLLLFLAFLVVNPLIQWISPGAGALDWSFLTLLIAGLFKGVFIGVSTWGMLMVFVPTVNHFLDSQDFRRAFDGLEPKEKLRATSITILTVAALLTLCVLF